MKNHLNTAITPQITKLIEQFDVDYLDRDFKQRSAIFNRVYAENPDLSWPEKQALGLAAFLAEKKIFVRQYDLFAGNIEHYDYSASLPLKLKEGEAHDFSRDLYDTDAEIANYLAVKKPHEDSEEYELIDFLKNGVNTRLFYRWAIGHSIAGYKKIIEIGLDALIAEGEEYLANQNDEEKKMVINNMLMVDRAAQQYIIRYSKEAKATLDNCDNPDYQANLRRIISACENIAHKAPESLFEAMQLFLLIHDVIVCENRTGSMSIGRFDQFLYPFYQNDLSSGLLNEENVLELIEAMWLKLSRGRRGFQNLTIGGADAEGNFIGNDLSLLCMEAMYQMQVDQPLLSLRINDKMPQEFWDATIKLLRTGIGFPALFNDEVIYKAKIAAGVDPDEVWDYGMVGCVEPYIQGKEYSNSDEMRICWPKILELMLFNGFSASTDTYLELSEKHDLSEFESFDDFYAWFKRELAFITTKAIKAARELYSTHGHRWAVPFLSSTLEGTYQSGKDATQGGVKYNFGTYNSIGMADVVDSLAAIKHLVYEKKTLTLPKFAEILKDDFVGQEELLAEIKNLPEKFGNNLPDVDSIMAELTDIYLNIVVSSKNQWNQSCEACFISVMHHASMGKYLAALPSGRRNGAPVANSLSPCQGNERSGPTATMNSALVVDHTKLASGMVLDMKFSPQFLETEEHRQGLIDLIKTYFAGGGMELQLNVVARDTLLKAQKDPEQYKNLIVRVSGFSAYFVYLDKTVQDEIIRRTEHQ